jgi:hypothetical protein
MSLFQVLFVGIAVVAIAGIVYWIKLGAPSDQEHKWWKLF